MRARLLATSDGAVHRSPFPAEERRHVVRCGPVPESTPFLIEKWPGFQKLLASRVNGALDFGCQKHGVAFSSIA